MSFIGHLKELRSRFLICIFFFMFLSVAGYMTFPWWSDFLLAPLGIGNLKKVVSLAPLEVFSVRLRYAFLLGGIYTFPVFLYELMAFVLPALKKNEKQVITLSLGAGFFLFLFGTYYAYEHVLPLCLSFFRSLSAELAVDQQFRYSETISFVSWILLSFAFVFQFPCVLFGLIAAGAVSCKTLLSHSRFMVIGIFTLSAIVTPPDVLSQVFLALPLILLFYITVFLGYIFKGEGKDV
jgi:sec-independent protein translocase protein TatC